MRPGESFPRIGPSGAERPASPPWLITFADLVSLILVFFVMLFAMSTLDRVQLQQILGRDPSPDVIALPEALVQERSMERAPVAVARDPDYLLSVLKTKLESDPLLKDLPLQSYGDRVVLTIPATRLAADLEAGPTGRTGALVHALAGALQTLPNQIVIDGFSPATSGGNRWRNGLTLAHRIASGLEEAGIEGPVLARGHVAANEVDAARVDVVLMDGTAPILAPIGAAAP